MPLPSIPRRHDMWLEQRSIRHASSHVDLVRHPSSTRDPAFRFPRSPAGFPRVRNPGPTTRVRGRSEVTAAWSTPTRRGGPGIRRSPHEPPVPGPVPRAPRRTAADRVRPHRLRSYSPRRETVVPRRFTTPAARIRNVSKSDSRTGRDDGANPRTAPVTATRTPRATPERSVPPEIPNSETPRERGERVTCGSSRLPGRLLAPRCPFARYARLTCH